MNGDGVPNAAVDAFTQIRGKMYAGGHFHLVAPKIGNDRNAPSSSSYVARRNLFSFSVATGAIKDAFHPQVNGTVWALASDGKSVYVAGNFTRINGVRRQGLAKLNPVTGAVRQRFHPQFTSGEVTDLQLFKHRLFVSGTFPNHLVALNPTTGHNTGYVNLRISGQVANRFGRINSGPTEVSRFAISPGGYRMMAIGNFRTVNGNKRYRAVMIDLAKRGAKLDSWHYSPLRHACRYAKVPDQLRDVDFSPNGDYFVIVATGGVPRTKYLSQHTDICDAAAKFQTMNASPAAPEWINYTGGDSLYAVAVTGSAVYVQGHQRWLDNPDGRNFAGPGAVYRQGIGAINPSTGFSRDFPLKYSGAWNPPKTRGEGGKVLYATKSGLWVGSDGTYFDRYYHNGIAYCPM